MVKPLVSVIMPAFNCEEFIGESIESVLAQDYENVELLVVDDGSTDSTPDVVRSFGSAVNLLHCPKGGAAAARNYGMNVAGGEFVSFLDADDIWHPQKLSTQFNYIDGRNEVGIVFSAWQEWEPDEAGAWHIPAPFLEPIATSTPDPQYCGWLYSRLLLDCELHTITVLIRKSVIDSIGRMNTDLASGEDYEYWLRVSRQFEIHKLRDVVALYRIRPGSLARQAHERNFGYEVLDNALRTWGVRSPDGSQVSQSQLRRRIARLWLDFAYMHFHYGDMAVAANASKRVIRERPLWFGGWKYYALSKLKRLFT